MKNKSLSIKSALIITLIVLLDAALLFYLKYSNHHLSFHDFSLAKIGNILNLIFTSFTILGIFTLYFKKVNITTSVVYLLIGFLNLFLLSIVVINFITIPSREYYLLSLSFAQVLIISVFSLFQFTQFFLILIAWQKIFKIEKLAYLRALVNCIFIAMGLLVFTLIFINSGSRSKANTLAIINKSNVAVVLGAAVWSDNKPSPSLAFRVDKAAELYKNGIVDKIQLTGGNAPGELSEAEVSLNHIMKKGIDKKDVWIEKSTTSTIEQVRFIKNDLIKKRDMKSVTIISDIYHLQRAKEICKFYNINAKVSASDLNLKTDKIIFYQLRECVALLLFWLFAL